MVPAAMAASCRLAPRSVTTASEPGSSTPTTAITWPWWDSMTPLLWLSAGGDPSCKSRVVSRIEQCAARQRHLLAPRPPRVAELPDHGILRTSLEILFGVVECCTHLTMVSLPRKAPSQASDLRSIATVGLQKCSSSRPQELITTAALSRRMAYFRDSWRTKLVGYEFRRCDTAAELRASRAATRHSQ